MIPDPKPPIIWAMNDITKNRVSESEYTREARPIFWRISATRPILIAVSRPIILRKLPIKVHPINYVIALELYTFK